jgi:hypothetical protein
MNKKDCVGLLTSQAVVLGLVFLIFYLVETKPVAGVLAGLLFTTLGGVTVIISKKWKGFLSSFTFWLSILFLFGMTLPLLLIRLFSWGIPFHDLSVFGIPGPRFHHASEAVYVLLMLGTFLDLSRARLSKD